MTLIKYGATFGDYPEFPQKYSGDLVLFEIIAFECYWIEKWLEIAKVKSLIFPDLVMSKVIKIYEKATGLSGIYKIVEDRIGFYWYLNEEEETERLRFLEKAILRTIRDGKLTPYKNDGLQITDIFDSFELRTGIQVWAMQFLGETIPSVEKYLKATWK